jgi:hypothetical protein
MGGSTAGGCTNSHPRNLVPRNLFKSLAVRPNAALSTLKVNIPSICFGSDVLFLQELLLVGDGKALGPS